MHCSSWTAPDASHHRVLSIWKCQRPLQLPFHFSAWKNAGINHYANILSRRQRWLIANMSFSRAAHVQAVYFLQQQTDRLHRLRKSSRCSSCPKLSKAVDRETAQEQEYLDVITFWCWLSGHAKLGGKKKEVSLTKLVSLFPALSQTPLGLVLPTVCLAFPWITQMMD